MPAPRISRALLCLASVAYVLIYVSVLFVALATSGHELVRSPGAWYAAVAPVLYAGIAGAYAFRILQRPIHRGILLLLHLLVLPALLFSFLQFGLFLPVIAVLWWFSERGKRTS